MKLEPHGVGRERPARQPRPFDRALAFFDPLFARAALVVERDHALGRAAHVRHDEADAGIKFSGMPLDLGDNPPRLGPGSTLRPGSGTSRVRRKRNKSAANRANDRGSAVSEKPPRSSRPIPWAICFIRVTTADNVKRFLLRKPASITAFRLPSSRRLGSAWIDRIFPLH